MNPTKRLAQFLVAAVAATAALTAAVAPAHAATRAAVEPVTLAQTAVVVTTSTGPTIAAATSCTTKTMTGNLVTAGTSWPILGSFKQTTHYCWNGQTVTSRSTTYTGSVTASGSLSGVQYQGVVAGSEGWNCYRASGSTRACSGNAQYAEGQFGGCVLKVGCEYSYIELQSSENYKGQWFAGYRG